MIGWCRCQSVDPTKFAATINQPSQVNLPINTEAAHSYHVDVLFTAKQITVVLGESRSKSLVTEQFSCAVSMFSKQNIFLRLRISLGTPFFYVVDFAVQKQYLLGATNIKSPTNAAKSNVGSV